MTSIIQVSHALNILNQGKTTFGFSNLWLTLVYLLWLLPCQTILYLINPEKGLNGFLLVECFFAARINAPLISALSQEYIF